MSNEEGFFEKNGDDLRRAGLGGLSTAWSMLGGDLGAGQQYTDAILDGEYGEVAQRAGQVGDAVGGGVYDLIHGETKYAGTIAEGRAKMRRQSAASRARRAAAAGECFGHLAE